MNEKSKKKAARLKPLTTNVNPTIYQEVEGISKKEQRSVSNVTHLLLRLGLEAWKNGNRNTAWLSLSALALQAWPQISASPK